MKREHEINHCALCEAKYIEECKCPDVLVGGKTVLPEFCWREDQIKMEAKPHDKNGHK